MIAWRLGGLLALVLLAGCAGQSSSPAVSPPVRLPKGQHNLVRLSTLAVASAVSDLQSAYAAGDWSAVTYHFSDSAAGSMLVNAMRNWKAESVNHLRVTLVYRQPLPHGYFIGTVEFSSDVRAIPVYSIYEFRVVGGVARVTAMPTGLHGTTYTNTNWRVTRSKHFIIYHSPYELQGADRAAIAGLEFERQQFIRKFGVHVAPLTAYYWYPQQQLMAPLTQGMCGTSPGFVGCADPYTSPPSIQTSEWPSYHEPIHVYELALEPPAPAHAREVYVAPLFIGEGTAVALEDRQVDPRLSDYCSDVSYIPLDDCARQAVLDVDPVTVLSDHGFKSVNAGDAYAMGGSFVKYLILHYGYHSFGHFYYALAAQPSDGVHDYNVATERVYHRTIQQLLGAWKSELCSAGC